MIYYHDKCEWVNVSSGTGSPGFPRQNPESHKMVVCVCREFCTISVPANSVKLKRIMSK